MLQLVIALLLLSVILAVFEFGGITAIFEGASMALIYLCVGLHATAAVGKVLKKQAPTTRLVLELQRLAGTGKRNQSSHVCKPARFNLVNSE
jgi:hypothetical protein